MIAASSQAAGGGWRTARVTGPLGEEVAARWWWAPPEAFVESAAASGLVLAGGSRGNDPLGATSRGTGELIAAAIRAGAARVVVGVGGSASTDGGLGAVEALESAGLLDSGGLEAADVLVACDVDVPFVEAAERFGPQKGASVAQVSELRDRLVELAERYRRRFGVDVTSMPRSGAAGGLAGGLAALGAKLVGGFDLVAEFVGLERRIAEAGLVVTGEGRLDSTSWTGKVVSGVLSRSADSPVPVPVLVVAGSLGPRGLAASVMRSRGPDGEPRGALRGGPCPPTPRASASSRSCGELLRSYQEDGVPQERSISVSRTEPLGEVQIESSVDWCRSCFSGPRVSRTRSG